MEGKQKGYELRDALSKKMIAAPLNTMKGGLFVAHKHLRISVNGDDLVASEDNL